MHRSAFVLQSPSRSSSSSSSSHASRAGLFAERRRRNEGSASPSSFSDTDEDDALVSATTKKNLAKTSKHLFRLLDQFGLSLKPKALKAKDQAATQSKRTQKIRFALQSSGLFSLFILYRAYRGFFVILPAVFREVYSKLEHVVDSPFVETTPDVVDGETTRKDPFPLRTAITVSTLAGVVTLSYVLGGAIRVMAKFFTTITHTSNVPTSFEAAAEQVMINENLIAHMMTTSTKQQLSSKNMNGYKQS